MMKKFIKQKVAILLSVMLVFSSQSAFASVPEEKVVPIEEINTSLTAEQADNTSIDETGIEKEQSGTNQSGTNTSPEESDTNPVSGEKNDTEELEDSDNESLKKNDIISQDNTEAEGSEKKEIIHEKTNENAGISDEVIQEKAKTESDNTDLTSNDTNEEVGSGNKANQNENTRTDEAKPLSKDEVKDEADSENVAEPESTEALESAATAKASRKSGEKIVYNLGSREISIIDEDGSAEGSEAFFESDGNYCIQLTENNPYFPYEVQFKYDGKVTTEWFLTPEDKVEIGGHVFSVRLMEDGVYTAMSLRVGEDDVIIYPQRKTFTNKTAGGTKRKLMSAANRNEKPVQNLTVDLSAYTPVELNRISIDTLLAGVEIDSKKVVWAPDGSDEYEVNSSGDNISLRRYSNNSSSKSHSFNIYVGEDDQLATSNDPYQIQVTLTPSLKWLIPSVYLDAERNNAIKVNLEQTWYSDWSDYGYLRIQMRDDRFEAQPGVYASFKVNPEIYPSVQYDSMLVYEGRFESIEEAMASGSGTPIEDFVFSSDHTGRNIYLYLVSMNSASEPTGGLCLSVKMVNLYDGYSLRVQNIFDSDGKSVFCKEDEDGIPLKEESYSKSTAGNTVENYTYSLYKGCEPSEQYALSWYYSPTNVNGATLKAAYQGVFDTLDAANEAGAKDIKDELIQEYHAAGGYKADYSKGVPFSFFIELENGETEVRLFTIKLVESEVEMPSGLDSSTLLWFTGLYDKSGNKIDAYLPLYSSNGEYDDSYGEFNYPVIIVNEDQDLTSVAPDFISSDKANVYAEGKKQEPKKTLVDFSSGIVQYTVTAEDGKHQQNYWLQIVKINSKNSLLINSFQDPEAKTEIDADGVIHSKRELIIDALHNNYHDILVANLATEGIETLKADLESDTLVLDEFWTFKGKYQLPGSSEQVDGSLSVYKHNSLYNLAKIRLYAKDNVKDGSDVQGTLTISAGGKTLAILELSGTVGNPMIITEEVPDGVKYVPYGTVIQNNNKYRSNTPRYSIQGNLPEGVSLRDNGEIYGVPMETGEFHFTVKMNNSNRSFRSSEKDYVLTIKDNEDANVDAETDADYELLNRVPRTIYMNETAETYEMRSNGQYTEYKYVFLDGKKLSEGQDYTSESGSTRITLKAQTLRSVAPGRHTLAIEFRTRDTEVWKNEGELKRSNQNYYLEKVQEGKEQKNEPKAGAGASGKSVSANGSSSSGGGAVSAGTLNSPQSVRGEVFGRGRTSRPNTPGSWSFDSDKNVWTFKDERNNSRKGWIVVDHYWYYLGNDGAMLTGWQFINGRWFYFCSLHDGHYGEMLIGWQYIDGKLYYMEEKDTAEMGMMSVSTKTPDGYYVDSSGVWDGKPAE